MKDKRIEERIQHSLNAELSGLRTTSCQRDQFFENATGGYKVKRKISAVAVLAVVLMLITVMALAVALLSSIEVVEQVAVPIANETLGESYSADATRKLLQIAEENGITLPQNTIRQIDALLSQGEGHFKEEMLMAFAKAEFGDEPSAWTLEEQNWFDDVCVAIGFVSEKQKTIPEQGEDAKQPIINAAREYVCNKYGSIIPLDNPTRYSIGVQYLNGDEDGVYHGMYWSVSFVPHVLEGSEYWIYLNDDATIIGEWVRAGLSEGLTVNQVFNIYSDSSVYGSYLTWNQEVFRSLQNSILLTGEEAHPAYRCLRYIAFPDLPESGISSEEAIQIAKQYHSDRDFYSEAHVFLFQANSPALLQKHNNLIENPVWKVLITSKGGDVYTVEIDSVTGTVVCSRKIEGQYRPWWMIISPWGVIDEVGIDYLDSESAG